MKKLKIKEIRKMKDEDIQKKINELKLELLKERGNVEMGGNVKNSGRIKIIRKDIARMLTIKSERERKK